MVVIYVFLPAFLLCELLRKLLRSFWKDNDNIQKNWQLADSLRFAVILVLLVIGPSHFSPLKYDMLAMLPPPIPPHLSIIYLTGVFEVAGAIGLLLLRTRLLASYCLIIMLLCLFPANIYAALHDIPFNGRPATPLIIRTPIQLLLIISLVVIAWHERKNRTKLDKD